MSPDGRGRLLTTRALVGGMAVLAAAVTALAIPGAIRFAVAAPAGFWAMALGALVVDVPRFGVVPRGDLRNRSTLSVCFTFAIFVLWGAAPAIVVQAVAGAVTAAGQRYSFAPGYFLVARLVLATAAAELVVRLTVERPIATPGTMLTGQDILAFLLLAVVWFTVSYGLMAATWAAVSVDWLRHSTAEISADLFGSSAAVLVVSPLLTTVTGWWPLFLVLPLAVWSGISRSQIRQENSMSREPVSGSLNRQWLTVGVESLAALDRIEAQGPRPFGIILISSESLVAINRTLGREMYERIARVVAQRLIDVYGVDLVGRLAGEGNVIVVPDLSEANAQAQAEAAVAIVARPIEMDGIPFTLEPHGGVALSPQHGRDLDTLLPKAEFAMSQGLRADRPATVYVQQAADIALRRIELLREAHAALLEPARQGEIAVHYQPQVELATGRLSGVEALIRWFHPSWGPISPTELIESVEPTDVMHLLTRHVLTTVTTQMQRWHQQHRWLPVSVNVSGEDLRHPGFVDDLMSVIRAHGIGPEQLTIEITESTFIGDAPAARQACDTLARLGFRLSLDDFGTGHASLQQARRLPLAEVKIDQSYVGGVVDNPADLAIVTGIHELAQVTGLRIVAEGIEDRRTAEVLANLDGIIGQGYYFGRPMTPDALQIWFDSPPRSSPA